MSYRNSPHDRQLSRGRRSSMPEGRRLSQSASKRRPPSLSPRNGALITLSSRADIPPPPPNAYVADVNSVFSIEATSRCVEPVNDRVIWTGDNDGSIRIRTLPKGNTLKQLKGKEDTFCTALAFIEESKKMWVAFHDGYLRLYNAITGELEKEFVKHSGAVHCLIPLEGTVYTGGDDWKIGQWEPEQGTFERAFYGHKGAVRCLLGYTGPTGSILFSGSNDGTIRAWDPYAAPQGENDTACRHVFTGHDRSVTALEAVPQANQLWSGGEDNTVRVWSLETLSCQQVLNGHSAPIASLLLIESRVWSGDKYGRIMLWDVNTLSPLQEITNRLPRGGGLGMVTAMKKVVPCTSWKVWTAGSNGIIQCWNAETVPIVFDASKSPSLAQNNRQRGGGSLAAVEGGMTGLTEEVREYIQQMQEELEAVRREAELAYERDRQEVQRELETQQLLAEENEALKKRLEELGEEVPEGGMKGQYASDPPAVEEGWKRQIRELKEQLAEANRQISKMEQEATLNRAEPEFRAANDTTSENSHLSRALSEGQADEGETVVTNLERRFEGENWAFLISEKPHELTAIMKEEISEGLGVSPSRIENLDLQQGSLIANMDVRHSSKITPEEMQNRLNQYHFDRLRSFHDNPGAPKTGLDAAEQELLDTNIELAHMQDEIETLKEELRQAKDEKGSVTDRGTVDENQVTGLEREPSQQKSEEEANQDPFNNSKKAYTRSEISSVGKTPVERGTTENFDDENKKLKNKIQELQKQLEEGSKREPSEAPSMPFADSASEIDASRLQDEITKLREENERLKQNQANDPSASALNESPDNSNPDKALIEELKAEIEKLKNEKDILENELEVEKDAGDHLREHVKDQSEEIGSLRRASEPAPSAQNESLTDDNELREENEKLKNKIQELQKQLGEGPKRELSEAPSVPFADSASEIDASRVENESTKLREESDKLQKSQASNPSASALNATSESPDNSNPDKALIEELKAEIEKLKNEKDILENELEVEKDAGDHLRDYVKDQNEEIGSLRRASEPAPVPPPAAQFESLSDDDDEAPSVELSPSGEEELSPPLADRTANKSSQSSPPAPDHKDEELERLRQELAERDEIIKTLRNDLDESRGVSGEPTPAASVRGAPDNSNKEVEDLKKKVKDLEKEKEAKNKEVQKAKEAEKTAKQLEEEKKSLEAQVADRDKTIEEMKERLEDTQQKSPVRTSSSPVRDESGSGSAKSRGVDPRLSIDTEPHIQEKALQELQRANEELEEQYTKEKEDHAALKQYVDERLKPLVSQLERERGELQRSLEQAKADRSLTPVATPAVPSEAPTRSSSAAPQTLAASTKSAPPLVANKEKEDAAKEEELNELKEDYEALQKYVKERLLPQVTSLEREREGLKHLLAKEKAAPASDAYVIPTLSPAVSTPMSKAAPSEAQTRSSSAVPQILAASTKSAPPIVAGKQDPVPPPNSGAVDENKWKALQEDHEALEDYLQKRLKPQLSAMTRSCGEKDVLIHRLEAEVAQLKDALDSMEEQNNERDLKEEKMKEALESLEEALEKERGGKEPNQGSLARGTVPTLVDPSETHHQERPDLQEENATLRDQLHRAEGILDTVQDSLVRNSDLLKDQSKETEEMLNKLKTYNKEKNVR